MSSRAITARLEAATSGDPLALDQLVVALYDELRGMARGLLHHEIVRGGLDTTALVHEAYLKLVGSSAVTARGRAYFFGAATRAMRQVLVDAARTRRRLKRGAGEAAVPLSGLDPPAPADPGTDVLAIDAALTSLSAVHPRPARVVECRFFGGLVLEEIAEVLDVSLRTVKRDWNLAQAWLFRELEGPDRESKDP